MTERPPDAAVIVPPRWSAVPSKTAETAPTQPDRHVQLRTERGRMDWQKATGYNGRALAEAAIGRYKRVIGEALRFWTAASRDGGAIAVRALNRRLGLGRQESLRRA